MHKSQYCLKQYFFHAYNLIFKPKNDRIIINLCNCGYLPENGRTAVYRYILSGKFGFITFSEIFHITCIEGGV